MAKESWSDSDLAVVTYSMGWCSSARVEVREARTSTVVNMMTELGGRGRGGGWAAEELLEVVAERRRRGE